VQFVAKKWGLSGIIQNKSGALTANYAGVAGTSARRRLEKSIRINKTKIRCSFIVMVFFFSSILRRNRCDKCDKKFQKIEELMQHTQVVHGKDLLYYCKQCDVSFNGMEQMRDHAKKFHTYYRKKQEQEEQEQEQEQEQGQEKKSQHQSEER
jgi:hypothetical protein